MMVLSPHQVRRLAFVRYLYQLGLEQCRQPEPRSAAAVLTFHDAIDLTLGIAAECLHVLAREKPMMVQLFEKVDERLQAAEPGRSLPGRGGVRRLNDVRNGLKHKGLIPNRTNVEECRAAAEYFFAEAPSVLFGISLADLSIVEFISSAETREHLRAAEKAGLANRHAAGISCARAMFTLLNEYEERYRHQLYGSPFSFGELEPIPSEVSDRAPQLSKFIYSLSDAIEEIRWGLKLVALGVDYRKYARFLTLTPRAWAVNGTVKLEGNAAPRTSDELRFCIDFVVECALRLQEFEFSVGEAAPNGREGAR
jgi:hypothetical protein